MENGGFSSVGLIIGLIFTVVMFIPYVMIIRKAGYSGWWVLILFVPIVNFIMLWVFALARWPVEERAAGLGAEKVF
jgi:uncharacterized membrane protein YhaH (DUF805 family)